MKLIKKVILMFMVFTIAMTHGLITLAADSDVITWQVSTCWTPSINLVDGDTHMIEILEKMSNGKFKIEFYPAESVVGTTELFDAVQSGMLDAASDYPGYWTGRERALDFFFSYPVGMTAMDMQLWLYQGDGLDLIREIYGKYNIMYFPVGRGGMESGLRSNVPLINYTDFKGVKARFGTRPGNYIFTQLGGTAVSLAGGELYTGLERGVIDAAEFSYPSTDWGMGFQEITKFWCLPGWYQPTWGGGWMINMDSWNALPDDLKEIFKVAAHETNIWTFEKWEYESIEATKNFLEIGTQVTTLDDETMEKIFLLAKAYTEDNAKQDPMFKKVAKSYYQHLRDFSQWREMQGEWGFGTNSYLYPDLE